MEKNSLKIEILKKEFPECFDRDGNFNIEKFGEVISPETKIFKDSYGLNWLGKSYARALAQGEPRKMLREDTKHNNKDVNKDSENLYIKGDNLEVLKHLHGGYKGAIKMIYIDPPYNTKSGEFVYNDDRDFSKKELEKLVKANIIDEDEMERIKKWEGESSSHSAWLTFMFPRLYLAQRLLTEDGVIFISIDDNEVAQLKLMCDEIFDEENFLGSLVWKRRTSSGMADKKLSVDHEYVLSYQNGSLKSFKGIEKDFKNYKNPNNDPKGPWMLDNLTVGMTSEMRPNQFYDLIDPKTGNAFSCNPNRVWAYIPSSMEKLIVEGRIYFPTDISKRPMLKRYKANLKDATNPFSSFMTQVGLNTEGTKIIQNLFERKVFDYAKPVSLVKTLANQLLDENEILLDFFSGSGSSAHAVSELNLESKGNRKWIMVQLEEELSKKTEAYKFCTENKLPTNITSIGIERIKRANEQMLDEKREEEKEYFDRESVEKKLGFKVYETRDKIRELDLEDEFSPQYQTPKLLHLSGNDPVDLVNTYKLQDGYPLVTNVVTENLSWEKTVIGREGTGRYIYTSYRVEDTLYLIHPINTSDVCKSIVNKLDTDPEFKVGRIVVYGFTNIESKYRMELIENLKTYSNKKSAHIDFEVRY